jgi:acyl-CoA dehydrogenase
MRLIGLTERMLERMCRRSEQRVTFGKPLAEQTVTLERIAESRILIEQSRLLTLKAAHMMDTVGNKAAKAEIAMIKVAVPNAACKVIDWVMQAFGGAGMTNDFGIGSAYATARLLRIADGPDEVHRNQLARLELARHRGDPALTGGSAQVLEPEPAQPDPGCSGSHRSDLPPGAQAAAALTWPPRAQAGRASERSGRSEVLVCQLCSYCAVNALTVLM